VILLISPGMLYIEPAFCAGSSSSRLARSAAFINGWWFTGQTPQDL